MEPSRRLRIWSIRTFVAGDWEIATGGFNTASSSYVTAVAAVVVGVGLGTRVGRRATDNVFIERQDT
jgi:hypothetical protein